MNRAKKKKQYRMEQQDVEGISRKQWKHTVSLELFVFLKILCIMLIPIMYFVYSPLLVVCMLAYFGLYFLTPLVERTINTSVIKKNHIKVPKLDSALALIIIVVALFGVCLGGTNQVKQAKFDNMPQFGNVREIDFDEARQDSWWDDIVTDIKNFGSLLTGERSVSVSNRRQFGMVKPPENFVASKKDLPDVEWSQSMGGMPNFGGLEGGMPNFGGGRPQRPNIDFSIEDIPVEYMFSSIVSAVSTVLIFSVSAFGILSLLLLAYRLKKFDKTMNETITIDNVNLTDEEIDKILSFGEFVAERTEDGDDDISEVLGIQNAEEESPCLGKVSEALGPTTEEEDIAILGDNFSLDDIYEDGER